MKTSKIIFISLLAAIALVILAGFLDVRINGLKNRKDMIVKKEMIPTFKVIYLNNITVVLSYSDSSFIGITSHKESLVTKLDYNLKNDTLRISGSKLQKGIVNIYTTDSLKSIIAVKSDLTINRFMAKNLTLDIDSTYLILKDEHNKGFSFLSLDINAKNHSNVSSGELKAGELKIFLKKSDAYLDVTAGKINGMLSDSSFVMLKQADDISLKKDSTSRIIINQ